MFQDLTFTRASFVSLIDPGLMGGIAAALAEATLRQAIAAAQVDARRFLSAQPGAWSLVPGEDR